MQWIAAIVLAAVTAFVTALVTIDMVEDRDQQSAKRNEPRDGAKAVGVARRSNATYVRFRSDTEEPIPVARSKRAMEALSEALEFDDEAEIGRMIASGDVMLARPGTSAELLEESTFYSRVRFHNGMGVRTGFVISDSFNPRFVKIGVGNQR